MQTFVRTTLVLWAITGVVVTLCLFAGGALLLAFGLATPNVDARPGYLQMLDEVGRHGPIVANWLATMATPVVVLLALAPLVGAGATFLVRRPRRPVAPVARHPRR